MPRRPKGRGTVYQRTDGRFVARLPMEDGPPAYRYRSTRAEAEDALADLLRDQKKGIRQPRGVATWTVGDLLDGWLAAKKGTTRAPDSWRRLHNLVTLHLKPTLGSKRVLTLETADIDRWRAQQLDAGKSPETVRRAQATLRAALQKAVDTGKLGRNVAALSDRIKPQKAEKIPLQPYHVSAVIGLAPTLRLGALWVTKAVTGARVGELLATYRDDYQLPKRGRGSVKLSRTVSMEPKGPISKRTGRPTTIPTIVDRTKSAQRTLPLLPVAVKALRLHLQRQAKERERAGETWQETGLMFCTEIGTVLNPSNVENRDWRQLREAAGLPKDATPHILRHTLATDALNEGRPLNEIAAMLGHASTQVTATVYAHRLARVPADAFDRIGERYARAGKRAANGRTGTRKSA